MVVGETIFISEQFEGVITYVHHSGLKIVKCYGTNNVVMVQSMGFFWNIYLHSIEHKPI